MSEIIELFPREILSKRELILRYRLAEITCEAAIEEMRLCGQALQTYDRFDIFPED